MFQHPFTMIVSGGTGCGKTHWIHRYLTHYTQLIHPVPEKILYAYGELNETIMEMQSWPHLQLHAGVPDEETILGARDRNGRLLLILDDLMLNVKRSYLDALFTKGSHNWNVSVVLLTQHIFTPEMRVARPNSHYLILMRNPAGELQVRNLGAQLFPRRTPYFLESYKDATREPFTYLAIDMHPATPDAHRLKTYIWPEEQTIVYTPKDRV